MQQNVQQLQFRIAFKNACSTQSISFILSLLENENMNIQDIINDRKLMVDALTNACCSGNFPVIRWLYQLNPILKHAIIIFNECLQNNFDITQWIFQESPLLVQNMEGDFGQLKLLCLNNKLEQAKFIFSLHSEYYESQNPNELFYSLCTGGLIEMGKWLVSVYPKMDIAIDDHDTILDTCEKLNFIIWQFGYNRQYRSTNYYRIIKYLQTLRPYLYTIVEKYSSNHEIEIKIHPEKEQQHIVKTYLMWLTSTISPNQNCHLYHLPDEISRLIIQYYA